MLSGKQSQTFFTSNILVNTCYYQTFPFIFISFLKISYNIFWLCSSSSQTPLRSVPHFFTYPNLCSHNFKTHQIQFMLALDSCVCGTIRRHTHKENCFSVPLSCQSLLSMRLCAHPSFPCWDYIWLELTKVWYMLSKSLWAHMCNFCVVCKKLFFPYSHPSTTFSSYHPFYSFFLSDSWALEGGV